MAWRIVWGSLSGILTYGLLTEVVFLLIVRTTPRERRHRRPFQMILALPLSLNLALSLDGWRASRVVHGMYEAASRDDVEGVRACFDDIIDLKGGPILNAPLTVDWILGRRPWRDLDPSGLLILASFDPADPLVRWVSVEGGGLLWLFRMRWSFFRWKIDGAYGYG